MEIDLNDPHALTLETVKRLIASGSDSTNTQLRVSNAGIAYLSTEHIGGARLEDVYFRFETWAEGTGWVGPGASEDDSWVSRICKALKDNWPRRKSSYIDFY